jgi:transposase
MLDLWRRVFSGSEQGQFHQWLSWTLALCGIKETAAQRGRANPPTQKRCRNCVAKLAGQPLPRDLRRLNHG